MERVEDGYMYTLILSLALGFITSILLIVFGKQIFSIFIQEQEAIIQGADYLRILGYSQLFMCIEITTQGLFNGLGRTYIPSIVSITLTAARIPLAYFIAAPNLLGINGIWWAISLSSVAKGILLVGIYFYLQKRHKLYPTNSLISDKSTDLASES